MFIPSVLELRNEAELIHKEKLLRLKAEAIERIKIAESKKLAENIAKKKKLMLARRRKSRSRGLNMVPFVSAFKSKLSSKRKNSRVIRKSK